jgi:hypothetical protein
MHTPVSCRLVAGIACTVFPLLATAQTKPPIATYWMSAETTSGMPMSGGAPSMSDMASMMMGGGMSSSSKRLLLQLGSQQAASGDPVADHLIPSAMSMGSSLPLRTPQKAERPRGQEGTPDNYEKPKGRLLLYWGCGAQAGAGQPYIIDFAKLANGQQWPADLFTRRVSLPSGPAASRSKTYGDWPNDKDSTRVPNDSSLRGEHLIKGNYSPEIKFNLDNLDYLAPLEISMSKQAAGAMDLRWKSVNNATGYFANVMGAAGSGKDGGNDMVWWVSANSKEFGEVLFSYIAPNEVARLIKEKVVLPPSSTECTVPKEVMAAAPNAMLRMIAYGDEANFAYPPRPKDPKAPWNPDWAAKVRVKSTAFQPIMEGSSSGGRASGSGSEDSGAAVGKALKGLLGF